MTSETQQTLPLLACMTCSMLLFPGIWLMQRRRLTDATKWNITVNHLTASMVLVAANALARLILAGGPLHTWPEGVNDFVIIMLKTLGGLAAVNLALLGMGHRIRLRELLLVSGWMGGLLLPMLSAIQSANGPSPMPDPAGLAGFILPGATTAMALSLLTRSGDTRGETTSKQGTLEGLLMATGWIGLLGSHLCAAGFPIQEIRNQLFLSLTGAMPVLIIVSCLSRNRDASSSMPLTGALLLGAAGIIKGGIVPGLMLGALGALLDVVLEGLIHRFPEKRAWSTGGLLTALSSVSVLAMTGSLKELPGQLTLVVFTLLLSGPCFFLFMRVATGRMPRGKISDEGAKQGSEASGTKEFQGRSKHRNRPLIINHTTALETVTDQLPYPSVILSNDNHVTHANERALKLFQWRKGLVNGTSLQNLFRVISEGPEPQADGTLFELAPTIRLSPLEARDIYEATVSPLSEPWNDRRLVTFEKVAEPTLMDTTIFFRKDEQERNETTHRILGQIQEGIRRCLQEIVGLSDLAASGSRSPTSIAEIRRSGLKIRHILDDARTYERLIDNHLLPDHRPIRLREMIAHVSTELDEIHALHLHSTVSDRCSEMLLGDEHLLSQAIRCLAQQACGGIPGSSCNLVVEPAGEEGELIRFKVTTKESSPLHDLNEKGLPTVDHPSKPAGMGLSLLRNLATRLGGQSGFKAGQVSEIWFTLSSQKVPVDLLEEECGPDTEAHRRNFHRARILIAAANPTEQQILSGHLDNWNLHHQCVASKKQALTELRTAYEAGKPYHIAVIDEHLEDAYGTKLSISIHRDYVLRDTVTLLMTSDFCRRDDSRMTEAGFVTFMTKPITSPVTFHDHLKLAWSHAIHDLTLETGEVHAPDAPLPFVILVSDHPEDFRNLIIPAHLQNHLSLLCMGSNDPRLPELEGSLHELIFVDARLESDPLVLTRKIRHHEPGTRRTPIIAIHAPESLARQNRCLQAGMDEMLPGPHSCKQLVQTINKWCATEFSWEQEPIALEQEMPEASGETSAEEGFAELDQARLDDLKMLMEEDGEAFLVEIFETFLTDARKRIDLMGTSLAEDNALETRTQSHGLKGACRNIGATEMARSCQALEDRAIESDLSEGEALLQAIVRDLDAVERSLNRELQNLQAGTVNQ